MLQFMFLSTFFLLYPRNCHLKNYIFHGQLISTLFGIKISRTKRNVNTDKNLLDLFSMTLRSQAFEDIMESYNLRAWWQPLSREEQKSTIFKLLDQLEVSNKQNRMKAARCILYLAQGCWQEVQSDKEQQEWTRTNVMLLYSCGVLAAFIELLNIEIEYESMRHSF